MTLDRENARATVPRTAAALAMGVTLAVMPAAPSTAVMPTGELRPNHGPVEVRTPGRGKRR